jgi:hypothetical protein
MTYNPTKYESYLASGYRGEAVTRTLLSHGFVILEKKRKIFKDFFSIYSYVNH